MSILNQKRILNLIPKVSAPVTIHVSQGDVGTEIQFTLVKGDELFVNPGNVSASVHGVREDGANFGAFTCTLSGSTVSFPLHSEMTAVKGSALAEIVIVDNGGNKVGSANFAIMVEESVFPLGVTYDNDVSVYESILAYVQTIPAQVQGEIADLENDVNSLNNALAQEVTNRNTAISNAVNVEKTARESADTTINARIDELVAPSGEAPSAAEVTDARVGADGTTYNSLGAAIRTQIGNIQDEFDSSVVDDLGVVYDEYVSVNSNGVAKEIPVKGGVKYAIEWGEFTNITTISMYQMKSDSSFKSIKGAYEGTVIFLQTDSDTVKIRFFINATSALPATSHIRVMKCENATDLAQNVNYFRFFNNTKKAKDFYIDSNARTFYVKAFDDRMICYGVRTDNSVDNLGIVNPNSIARFDLPNNHTYAMFRTYCQYNTAHAVGVAMVENPRCSVIDDILSVPLYWVTDFHTTANVPFFINIDTTNKTITINTHGYGILENGLTDNSLNELTISYGSIVTSTNTYTLGLKKDGTLYLALCVFKVPQNVYKIIDVYFNANGTVLGVFSARQKVLDEIYVNNERYFWKEKYPKVRGFSNHNAKLLVDQINKTITIQATGAIFHDNGYEDGITLSQINSTSFTNRTMILYFSNGELGAVNSYHGLPQGAIELCRIYFDVDGSIRNLMCDANIRNIMYYNGTPYFASFESLSDEIPTTLSLASKYYHCNGIENLFHVHSMSKGVEFGNDFYAVGTNGEAPLDYANVGLLPTKFSVVYNRGKSKNVINVVTENIETHVTNKKVLFIGDSLTNRGFAKFFKEASTLINDSIEMLGTMSNSGVTAEGREGWLVGTLTGESNYNANGQTTIQTTKASGNIYKNPFIRYATASDKSSNPSKCFVYDENNPQWVNDTYADNQGASNYVIFDFANYLSVQEVETPDCVVIALGTNDLSHFGEGDAITEMERNLDIVVNSILDAGVSKIVICSMPIAGTNDRFIQNLNITRALETYCNDKSDVVFAPCNEFMQRYGVFPSGEIVHFDTTTNIGYKQYGYAVYTAFKSVL